MTRQEAQERARQLGLTAWTEPLVVEGKGSIRPAGRKCVGFETAGLTLGEASTWEEAFDQVTRVIFAA